MSDRNALLDAFVDSLCPTAHRTAGVAPTHFDLSITPDELTAVAETLIRDYDALRAAEPVADDPEKVTLREELAAALEQVAARHARVPELVTELKGLRETGVSPTPPAAPEEAP